MSTLSIDIIYSDCYYIINSRLFLISLFLNLVYIHIHIYIYIYIYIYVFLCNCRLASSLRAILNKSWRQHPTRHQLYGHLSPITKTIQVRRTRHAEHCWRSRDELISDVLLWIPHMAVQKQDDQHEHTFSNYVRIRDVIQKTCMRR